MSGDLAVRFVQAIVDHDRAGLEALLAPDVDFRGLTPGRPWAAGSPAGVADVLLGHWFEDTDHVEAVTRLERGQGVGDVEHMAYRFDVTNDGGRHVVEQQAYYRVSGSRFSHLRILCSGFRPRATA